MRGGCCRTGGDFSRARCGSSSAAQGGCTGACASRSRSACYHDRIKGCIGRDGSARCCSPSRRAGPCRGTSPGRRSCTGGCSGGSTRSCRGTGCTEGRAQPSANATDRDAHHLTLRA